MDPNFITGVCLPRGLAVDDSHIYWAESWSTNCGTIGRANLDGTGVDNRFLTIPGYSVPSGAWAVAVAGSYIYLVGDQTYPLGGGRTISRADLDGANATPLATVEDPIGIAVDSSYLYWTDGSGGSVWRAPLQNTTPQAWQRIVSGAVGPSGLGVEGWYLHWANSGSGSIGRSGTDGSAPTESFITGGNDPRGVAVDSAELLPTLAYVECLPQAVSIGEASTCTATVLGTGAPSTPSGTVTFRSDSSGSFSGAGSCTLSATSSSQSSCDVTYTPTQGSAAHTITASYGGDQAYASSYEQTQLSVSVRSASVLVDCVSAAIGLGSTSTCTVTVADASSGTTSPPGGIVNFSSDSAGSFNSPSCTLSAASASQSRCAVMYTPTQMGSGTHTITTFYGGDQVHSWSHGNTSVAVTARATAVSLDCSPPSLSVGAASTCTATVADVGSGSASPPSGAANFSSDTSGDSFGGLPTCPLSPAGASKSQCQLMYTPAQIGSGKHTISAHYIGDQVHAANNGQATVTVTAPPTKPRLISPPVISGMNRLGHTLSSSVGSWAGTPPPAFAYQWQRCTPGCVNLSGASGSSYTPRDADVGAKLRVLVTASNNLGSVQVPSSLVGPIAPTPAQATALLNQQLYPSGKGATIAALLRTGSYRFSFRTPLGAGRVVINWYYLPRGATLNTSRPAPVLVAAGNAPFPASAAVKITIKLTPRGKQMLKPGKRLKLTAKGTYTPPGSPSVIATKTFTLKR